MNSSKAGSLGFQYGHSNGLLCDFPFGIPWNCSEVSPLGIPYGHYMGLHWVSHGKLNGILPKLNHWAAMMGIPWIALGFMMCDSIEFFKS